MMGYYIVIQILSEDFFFGILYKQLQPSIHMVFQYVWSTDQYIFTMHGIQYANQYIIYYAWYTLY